MAVVLHIRNTYKHTFRVYIRIHVQCFALQTHTCAIYVLCIARVQCMSNLNIMSALRFAITANIQDGRWLLLPVSLADALTICILRTHNFPPSPTFRSFISLFFLLFSRRFFLERFVRNNRLSSAICVTNFLLIIIKGMCVRALCAYTLYTFVVSNNIKLGKR